MAGTPDQCTRVRTHCQAGGLFVLPQTPTSARIAAAYPPALLLADLSLVDILPGEFHCDASVLAVKAHPQVRVRHSGGSTIKLQQAPGKPFACAACLQVFYSAVVATVLQWHSFASLSPEGFRPDTPHVPPDAKDICACAYDRAVAVIRCGRPFYGTPHTIAHAVVKDPGTPAALPEVFELAM